MTAKADLAAAWESGYWRGTSHEGPLNDAAVAAKNPHRATDDDAEAAGRSPEVSGVIEKNGPGAANTETVNTEPTHI